MIGIAQYTDDWFSARRGRVTASRVADVIARTKAGWGASRANYMAQLIAERLTDETQESYTNAAMQWGIATEPLARAAYEFYSDAAVEECGFVGHPSIIMSGASPDGLIGKDGMIEIKCPNTATHIDTLLGQSVPDKYIVQMQWQMTCVGRQWCDFVSFDPRMPENMRLFVRRVKFDAARVAELERDVSGFLSELDDKVSQLNARYSTKDMAA